MHVIGSTQENVQVQNLTDSSHTSDIEKYILPYRQKILDSLSTTMGIATSTFVKEKPGGSLGNLISDAMHWKAKELLQRMRVSNLDVSAPMFTVMNYGGIRQGEIPKGTITLNKIYETLPFENTLVFVECPIDTFVKMIKGINKYGWPVQWDHDQIKSLSQAKNEYKNILLVTNNYIANGGDHCDFLIPLQKIDSGILLRDVLSSYLKLMKEVRPSDERRVLK